MKKEPTAEHTNILQAVIMPTSPEEMAEVTEFANRLSLFLHDEILKYEKHPNRKLFFMQAAHECHFASVMSVSLAMACLKLPVERMVPTILGQMTAEALLRLSVEIKSKNERGC